MLRWQCRNPNVPFRTAEIFPELTCNPLSDHLNNMRNLHLLMQYAKDFEKAAVAQPGRAKP